MARGKAHSEETKAAVMAALLAGQSVCGVAKQYKIPKSVVSGWKSSLPDEQFEQVRTQKGERIEALLFGYLAANLTALEAQARVATDEQYLRKFPPQQLAVLHGVMADKGIRILEAIAAANGDETFERDELSEAADDATAAGVG